METPETVGFKDGMTSACVIARKLGKMYVTPTDAPKEIHDLAYAIDCGIGRMR